MTKIYESYCAPIDPEVLKTLQKAYWEELIPVTGNGEAHLGEVAKGIPMEDFTFDTLLKEDLMKVWSI